jgi:hypothetical protein
MSAQIVISPEAEEKIRAWLKAERGVAIWRNKDLGSAALGSETFTPGDAKSPNWRCGNTPDEIIHDPARFVVETAKEVARVKIRNGPPMCGGVNRQDRPRLDAALEKAGNGAYYVRDYSRMQCGSAWFEAVIMCPDSQRPLTL